LFPFARKRLAGLGPWARFVDTGAELDRLLNEDIGERQTSGARGDDILSMLLDSRYEDGSPLSPDSIRSHLRGLLFAGHETTMIAMAWMLQHLHANPEMLARTLTSIEGSVDEVLADPWLDAVVHETLRLYPIILGVVRRLGAPTELGPYAVPADTNVWVSIVMLHTNPEVFPEPARFRPERFLEYSPRPYEYAPFGGGHRRCIGAAFAVMETKVVLMTILRRLQLELAGARTIGTSRRNISMAPAGGVPLRVVRWR
jgi:cytochrome P450 family 110